MRPGPLLVRLCGTSAVAALLVPLVPGFVWILLAAVALLAAAAGVEALALRRVAVVAERAPRQVLSLGEGETVTVRLRLSCPWRLQLLVRQVWPVLIADRASDRRCSYRPGEELAIAFAVLGIDRGTAPLAPLGVSLTRLQLIERVIEVGPPAEIAVIPDLRAVARLDAQLNSYALRGLGSRLSARLGKGREFDRLREYVSGDEYRDVAWRASARHRKLIVREFRLDRSQDILLCLDTGHRMAARVARLTKLDHAVNGALLLGYACNRMEDRIGILSFASTVSQGPRQGRGGAHLRRLTDFAAGTRAAFDHTDYLALASHLRRALRHRTLVVVFTALAGQEREALLRSARAVSPSHLLLVLVLDDPDLRAAASVRPADGHELSRTLVAREIVASRTATIRDLRRLGALVVETTPSDVGLQAVNAYIDVKRRQLL